MRTWTAERVAAAAGARLLAAAADAGGPERAVIDSRAAGPGSLFVGLPGEHANGGGYSTQALAAGAWGVLTDGAHAQAAAQAAQAAQTERRPGGGAVLAADDPLRALQRLATAWRRHLKAEVIAITGSTGKTSTKDILHAVLAPHRRTVASRENYNTEIGLPLEILGAPAGTEVLVLEMGMRGPGQIAELAAIAEPRVGVIVSVGPVHLELLGSIAAIAAAKAELIAGLPPGGTAVVPAGEDLLVPHLRSDLETVTFGPGGDVLLSRSEPGLVKIDAGGRAIELEVPFTQAHLRNNLLAAVAAALAIGVVPNGRIELALSHGRGQRIELPGEVTVLDDCYNANPMSMRAALVELSAVAASAPQPRRPVAVLGDMLELGPDERDYHLALGEQATAAGVELLITVGPLAAAAAERFDGEVHVVADAGEAAALAGELIAPGDVVLVKGSRGVGLELVCETLKAES
jgi:UDP-N-acetylmuramoyl-tripeptide--D-alanyl-D-alanine ligase